MPLNAMQYFPLGSAYLCQDCNCVGNNRKQCPACASTALLGLAVVLDRKLDEHLQAESVYSWPPALAA